MKHRKTRATMAGVARGRSCYTRRERNVPAFWPVAWTFWADDWGYHRVKRDHRHPKRTPLREIHTKNNGPSIAERIASKMEGIKQELIAGGVPAHLFERDSPEVEAARSALVERFLSGGSVAESPFGGQTVFMDEAPDSPQKQAAMDNYLLSDKWMQ